MPLEAFMQMFGIQWEAIRSSKKIPFFSFSEANCNPMLHEWMHDVNTHTILPPSKSLKIKSHWVTQITPLFPQGKIQTLTPPQESLNRACFSLGNQYVINLVRRSGQWHI